MEEATIGRRPLEICVVVRTGAGIISSWNFFFFQAEDGIRDSSVTGVQTCALPICNPIVAIEPRKATIQPKNTKPRIRMTSPDRRLVDFVQIGRASCRERV